MPSDLKLAQMSNSWSGSDQFNDNTRSSRDRIRLAVCLLMVWVAVAFSACASEPESQRATTPQPTPTPKPPLIAYLYEGGLWTIEASGHNARLLVASPEGEAINAHVWALD